MNGIVDCNWGRIGFIVFGLLLAWLAGIYLTGIFLFLYYSLVFIVVFSVLQALFTVSSIRVYQSFSTERPVKGESILYTVSVSNELVIPSSRIKLFYRLVQPGVFITEDYNELYLGYRAEYKKKFSVKCPYRGIYTVGLDFIEIRDLLGILTVRRPAEFRTFYVLPRVNTINSPLKGIYNRHTASVSSSGLEQDPALFEGYKPYRSGESIRHISWKKFIATGRPLLKEYGKTAEPGIRIYLDTRRISGDEHNFLEMEDCSVEILVAFVKYCMDGFIPVSVRCAGQKEFDFESIPSGRDHIPFARFHHDTSDIMFHEEAVSPLNQFFSDTALGGEWGGTVLFITHLNDMEIFEFVERYSGDSEIVACIVNRSGFTPREMNRSGVFLEHLIERKTKIFCVDSANTIAGDLMRKCM